MPDFTLLSRFVSRARLVTLRQTFVRRFYKCICRSHHVGAAHTPSLTGHLNRGVDRVLEIVRVVGRGLVSIPEVHAIVARAHLAQGEPEMARN